MRTEDLISRLSDQPPRREASLDQRLGAALLVAGAGAALVIALLDGLRPDLLASATGAAGIVKFGCGAALGLAGWRQACRLSRPGLSAFCPVATALFVIAAALAGLGLDGVARAPAFGLGLALDCALPILALAAPALALGLAALRSGAPTRPALAGAATGLAAGAAGALAFATTCPANDPLFVIVAYGSALAGMSTLGALAAPRVLRW